MNVDLSAATILNGLALLVVSIIGWMLKGIYADFKAATEKLASHEVRLAVMEKTLERLEDAKLQ